MSDQTFGPCRSRATTKPRQSNEDPVFSICRGCGRVLFSLGGDRRAASPSCCGGPMERLAQQSAASLPAGHALDYQIMGGFNHNAIKLLWRSAEPSFRPRWVFLKNYTGGQLKFIPDDKKSPAVFPLADEDAYAYCNEDPCLECVFCCKWGFSFFVYFDVYGLIALPIDRKTANWQSSSAQREASKPVTVEASPGAY